MRIQSDTVAVGPRAKFYASAGAVRLLFSLVVYVGQSLVECEVQFTGGRGMLRGAACVPEASLYESRSTEIQDEGRMPCSLQGAGSW